MLLSSCGLSPTIWSKCPQLLGMFVLGLGPRSQYGFGPMVLKGCLLWGDRVIIPPTLQDKILEVLHEGHPGIVRMKALARSYVWWPGLDSTIESWVATCKPCQETRLAPPKPSP
uniref:Gypsy retrotransposon integrase-like protein 1 n=1 Tax=Micrurus carvalhoi TaxID=3147026 RepID=A0A2H6N0S2_9SAUR